MRCVYYPLVLAALAAAAPASDHPGSTEMFTFTPGMYDASSIIYEGEHDIVDIMIPLNGAANLMKAEGPKERMLLFFVEAHIDASGGKTYHGAYVYKGGEVTKLLDNGRALAASADNSAQVFIGGDDGLYLYEPKSTTARKCYDFGFSVKDIAKEHGNDVIYVLTDDGDVYKLSDDGKKKEKMDELKGAEQIMIDYRNNLYYYGANNQPYVRRNDGETRKIEGLPDARNVKLIRPPITNDGVVFLSDYELFVINPDGGSTPDYLEFNTDARPTAMSLETYFYKYLGYNKKIHEFPFDFEEEDSFDEY